MEGTRRPATVEFAPTAFAREVETLYRQRFLRAVSVGFRAKAFSFRRDPHRGVEGVEYAQQELLEISAVPVPANPRALARALASGLDVPRLRPLFTFDGKGDGEGAGAPTIGPGDAEEIVGALRAMRTAIG